MAGKAPGVSISMELSENSRRLLRDFHKLLTPGEIDFAAAKGAEVLRDAAIDHAPHGDKTHSKNPGRLKKNIVARVSKRKQTIDAYVGAVYGAGHAPHAHLVEFGTKKKRQTNKGKPAVFAGYGAKEGEMIKTFEVAPMPAEPFMQKAIDEKTDDAVRTISRNLTQRIQWKLNRRAK